MPGGIRTNEAVSANSGNWLDGTYVKVGQAGRTVSVAVIIAVSVNDGRCREVLAMTVGASEAETFWTEFLRSLVRRGLRGVKLAVSDAREGPKAAVARVLHATWQRCRMTPCETSWPTRAARGAASSLPPSLRHGRSRRMQRRTDQNGASISTTLMSLWLTNSLMPRPSSSRP